MKNVNVNQERNSTLQERVRHNTQKAKFKRVVALLCVVVMFITINSLKFEGVTLRHTATCGLEEHVHSESCYDEAGMLICGLEEHFHTDACYQQWPDPEPTVLDEYANLNSLVTLASSLSGEDEVVSSNVEDPVGEVEVELGDGTEDSSLSVEYEDATPAVEAAQPVYDLNGGDVAFLSDVLSVVEGNVGNIVSVGELTDSVVSAVGEHIIVEPVDGVENEYAVRVTQSFSQIELCIVGDEIVTLILKNGMAVEKSAAEEISASVEQPEYVQAEATEQNDDTIIDDGTETVEIELKQTEVGTEQTEVEITPSGEEAASDDGEQASGGEGNNPDVDAPVSVDEAAGAGADEQMVDDAQAGADAPAEKRRAMLNFSNYRIEDDHSAFLYDGALNAVLVRVGEIASVDGVEAALPESGAEGAADETLIITGDGEYEAGETVYEVTGLVLEASDGMDAAPEYDGTDAAPAEDGTNAAPAEDGTNVASEEDGTDAAPAEDGTDAAPAEEGSDAAPAEDGTDSAPAEDGTDAALAADGTDVTPTDDGTDVAPADDGTDAAPADDGTDAAPAEDGTDAAPTDDETNATPADEPVAQNRVALDFTHYIATDEHTAFLYDGELNAVLVRVSEIASVDGVEVDLPESAAGEELTLVITGDGEYELGGTFYAVTGLVLDVSATGEETAASEEAMPAGEEAAGSEEAMPIGEEVDASEEAMPSGEEEAPEGQAGEPAAEHQVILDFTNYIATDDHTVFLYDSVAVAVMVNEAEIASVDGVEVSLPDYTEEDEASINEGEQAGTLVITDNGEYALNGKIYTVQNLVLPVAKVENDTITITTTNEEATLLNVEPVFEETDENYDDIFSLFQQAQDDPKLMAMLADALFGVAHAEETEVRTLRMKLFNIGLQNVESGEEIEPDTNVHIETSLEEPIAGEDFALYHIVDGKAELVRDAVQCDSDGRAVGFDFYIDSLSPFALVYYTVDFHYGEEEVSIEGETQVLLSTLIKQLGIKDENGEFIEVANVASVSFSDERLVTVEQVSGEVEVNGKTVNVGEKDFLLTSREPFTSREQLILTMADKGEVVVDVTDDAYSTSSDLKRFLIDASIQAPKNNEGKYILAPNTNYSFTLTFKENPGLQFDNDNTLTYDLNESNLDFSDGGDSGKFTIKIDDAGTIYELKDNTYSIGTDGLLRVNFNKEDIENFNRLTASSNLRFSLTFESEVKENISSVHFTDEIEKEVELDTANSVSASKSAHFDIANGRVYYTVAIVSKGKSKNVVVEDTISDDKKVLTLNQGSIVATSSKGHPVSMTQNTLEGNTFKYTIDEMSNGEVVTFNYYADIDMSKIPNINGKRVQTGHNSVKVFSDGDPIPDTVNIDTTIDYTPSIRKDGAVVAEDGKTLTWTIVANEEAKVSMAGGTITDTIREGSRDIMKYSGSGITVEVYDANGTYVRTDNVSWADMTNKTDASWTYTVPESDANLAYKYVITYTTEVDTTGKTSQVTVNNDVENDGGNKGSGSGTVTPVGGEVKVYKNVEKVDLENREITWSISFNVPKEGLTKAVVTDKTEERWKNGHELYEAQKGIVSIVGLLEGEGYSTNVTGDGNHILTITFYKDKNNKIPDNEGLKAGTNDRSITITLKTAINETWLGMYEETSNTWWLSHDNNVELNANGDVITAKATAQVVNASIEKDGYYHYKRTVNGVELPYYRYELLITNVNSDVIEIYDEYDTTLLEPYDPNGWWDWRVSDRNRNHRGEEKVSYVYTDKGIKISTSADSLPKDPNSPTGYFDTYKLVYYLTVKDEAALKTIMSRASNSPDHTYTLENTANWDDYTDGGNVTYEYEGLTKEILNENELSKTDEEVYANFRITLNPGALTLNGGQPLTVTDEITSLSLDYDSIVTTPSEGVSYDQEGNTTTFTIPDRTKVVIEYRARVLFAEVAESGQTVKVRFNNYATMEGYHDEVSKEATKHNSGEGVATVPAINLMKYEAGNMTKKLKGATFVLYNARNVGGVWVADQPVTKKDGTIVSFTTGDDGKITVKGDKEQLGWAIEEDKVYFLRETVAPKGYMLADFDYQFTVSGDGSTDYGRYIYHTNDIMSAKNYKGTDVMVEKIWKYPDKSDASAEHDSDTVVVKLQQRCQTGTGENWGDWSDTIRMRVLNSSTGKKEWQDVSSKKITLNKGSSWKGAFNGLPLEVPVDLSNPEGDDVAVDYRIQEVSVNDVEPDSQKVNIVKQGNSYSYTVTNTVEPNTGDLELSKTVTGKDDTTTPFEFEITLTAPAGVTLKSSYNGTQGETVKVFNVNDGKISGIMLKNGEKAVINGLPAGTTYSVNEVNVPEIFTPKLTNPTGTIISNSSGAKVTVQAENVFTAKNTTFSVKKNFIGGNLNDREFTFKLTQVDANGSTTPVTTKLANSVTVTTDRATGTEQTMSFDLSDDFWFTKNDIGNTFWFMIEENVPEAARTDPFIDGGVKYANPYRQWVSVAISEADGALVVTKSTTVGQPDAEFTNEQLISKTATKEWYDSTAARISDFSGTATLALKQYYTTESSTDRHYTNARYLPVTLNGAVDTNGSTGPAGYESAPWTATWVNLPSYGMADTDGNDATPNEMVAFQYEVIETAASANGLTLADMVVIIDGDTVKNYLPAEIVAEKRWADGYQPDSRIQVEFELTRTPAEDSAFSKTVRVNANGVVSVDGVARNSVTGTPWTYQWDKLPAVNAAGTAYVYSVAEKVYFVPNTGTEVDITSWYVPAVDKTTTAGTTTITNTPKVKTVTVQKKWHGDLPEGMKVTSVTYDVVRKAYAYNVTPPGVEVASSVVETKTLTAWDDATTLGSHYPMYGIETVDETPTLVEYIYAAVEKRVEGKLSPDGDTVDLTGYFTMEAVTAEMAETATDALTMQNTYSPEKVKVVKVWKDLDNQNVNDSVVNGKKVTFQLMRQKKNGDGNVVETVPIGTVVELDGVKETTQWQYQWTDQPKGTVEAVTDQAGTTYTAYTYEYFVVEEAPTDENAKLYSAAQPVRAASAEDGVWVYTATNKVTKINARKIWENLDGGEPSKKVDVTFKLLRYAYLKEGDHSLIALQSGVGVYSDGSDTARIIETVKLDGTVDERETEAWKVSWPMLATEGTEVDSSGNTVACTFKYRVVEEDMTGFMTSYVDARGGTDNATRKTGANGDDTFIIKNTEMPSYALPSTGGHGTTLFYVAGSILTLLAAVLLATKKRSDGAGTDK